MCIAICFIVTEPIHTAQWSLRNQSRAPSQFVLSFPFAEGEKIQPFQYCVFIQPGYLQTLSWIFSFLIAYMVLLTSSNIIIVSTASREYIWICNQLSHEQLTIWSICPQLQVRIIPFDLRSLQKAWDTPIQYMFVQATSRKLAFVNFRTSQIKALKMDSRFLSYQAKLCREQK